MTKAIIRIFIITVVLAIAFIAGPIDHVWAQQPPSKNTDIKYTGEHGRNARVKTENGKVEIVSGTIYSVRGNSIVMDGESFSLSGAKIHDQLGLPVENDELYPGLQVKVVLRDGSVAGVMVKNFFRGKVVTDPLEIEQMRQKAVESQGR